MKKWIIMAIVLSIILTACGQAQADDEPFIWPDNFDGETLTIVAHWDIFGMRAFAEEFMLRNPGATIQITILENLDTLEAIEQAREHLMLEIMAGTAPVLIDGHLVDYLNPLTAQHFLDWWPLMNADPNFNEDDWFMNVFDALTRADGHMLSFPINHDSWQGNQFVLTNAAIPGLAEEMTGRESISMAEMMDIFTKLAPTLPTNIPWQIERWYDTAFAVETNIERFLDIYEGRVEFATPEFIDFINHARDLTSTQRNFGQGFNAWAEAQSGTREITENRARQDFFRIARAIEFDIFGIFDEDMPFVNPIPFATNDGHLRINPMQTMVLNSTATPPQQALALEFTRFMLEAPAHAADDTVLHGMFAINWQLTSHNRNLTPLLVNQMVLQTIQLWVRHGWDLSDGNLINNAHIITTHTKELAEWPMQDARYAPEIIREAIIEIIEQFHDGLITAEAAANDLQNRITLILTEMS